MTLRAELIEDGGLLASSAEFFRSPEFLAAEEATHTIRIEGASMPVVLPAIVRPVEGGGRVDAISPYGYPGGAPALEDPPDPREVDWSATGLVSLFVRERIGRPSLAGGSERSQVQVVDASGGPGIRKRLVEQIAHNERRGWAGSATVGGSVTEEDIRGFERAYGETMLRVEAAERYLYPHEYFERVLAAESSWLLTVTRAGELGAGAIAVRSDGFLHYFLGGTCDAALSESPMKNVFMAMISLADSLGVPLSLGGGVAPGDSLERFKRGFSNRTEPFRTHEVVCDPDAYEELSRGTDAPGGFFPAYRAG